MKNVCVAAMEGRIVRDAEGRGEPGPRYAVKFSVAVNDSKKNAQGTWEDVPSFFDCIVFGNYAAKLVDRLKKGVAVTVAARPRQRRYEAKDGTMRSAVEFIAESVTVHAQRPESFEREDAYATDDIPF